MSEAVCPVNHGLDHGLVHGPSNIIATLSNNSWADYGAHHECNGGWRRVCSMSMVQPVHGINVPHRMDHMVHWSIGPWCVPRYIPHLRDPWSSSSWCTMEDAMVYSMVPVDASVDISSMRQSTTKLLLSYMPWSPMARFTENVTALISHGHIP